MIKTAPPATPSRPPLVTSKIRVIRDLFRRVAGVSGAYLPDHRDHGEVSRGRGALRP